MPRVAVQFAYDGMRFESFARQPGRRTVEGEILTALAAAKALRAASPPRFAVASRTDAGVSAWENVFAVDTQMDPRAVAHVAVPDGLWFWNARAVDREFSPRRAARERTYQYSLRTDERRDVRAMKEAAAAFVGLHDFANFCRREPGVGTRRRIDSVRIARTSVADTVEVTAPNFLWEQVRRMVHALAAVGDGKRSPNSVADQLSGGKKPEPPAAPEPLVLKEVDVGIKFAPPSRAALGRAAALAGKAWAQMAFYDGLTSSRPTARR